jgi:hypothetical protein
MINVTEGWPLETVKERESGQKPSFFQKEKKEEETRIVVSQINSQGKNSDYILTQWEKELEMLENWSNYPRIGEEYYRNEIMKDRKGNLQE